MIIDHILSEISHEIYTEDEPFSRIGFRDENNGTTSYYTPNITKDDAKFIDNWCQELNISPLNTRLLKSGDNQFELRLASQIAGEEGTRF